MTWECFLPQVPDECFCLAWVIFNGFVNTPLYIIFAFHILLKIGKEKITKVVLRWEIYVFSDCFSFIGATFLPSRYSLIKSLLFLIYKPVFQVANKKIN